jgi:hypothetical protein
MKKAPERDQSPLAPVNNGGSLFERAGKAGECRLEIVAEALDDGDDGNGNTGRDQTIFDGGRAGLVFGKTREKTFHKCWLLEIHLAAQADQMVYEPFGSNRKVSAMNFKAVKLIRPCSGFCTVVNFLLQNAESGPKRIAGQFADVGWTLLNCDLTRPNGQFSSRPGN